MKSLGPHHPKEIPHCRGRALIAKVGGGPSLYIYLVIYSCNFRINIVILPIIIVL